MDFRRMTPVMSCYNLEEGFTYRIIVMLIMCIYGKLLFSHINFIEICICMKY